jgi:hypothetical protein
MISKYLETVNRAQPYKGRGSECTLMVPVQRRRVQIINHKERKELKGGFMNHRLTPINTDER